MSHDSVHDLSWRVAKKCESGACVRVARRDESVFIGNTNDPEGAASEFTTDEWREFIDGVKQGDFDSMA